MGCRIDLGIHLDDQCYLLTRATGTVRPTEVRVPALLAAWPGAGHFNSLILSFLMVSNINLMGSDKN